MNGLMGVSPRRKQHFDIDNILLVAPPPPPPPAPRLGGGGRQDVAEGAYSMHAGIPHSINPTLAGRRTWEDQPAARAAGR